ncbi:hypothetical protein EI427_25525 (plasmid) [Flammeovirga pectinis]|uniref:HTTM-like domain-containing protein n=1 Tax=Flammeovirga pectinis TaxID=2494373 RepID=A0A3S9PBS7_9BACT|nr:sporulation-delaying protein SdpB family protein [Flammeovirga pectinis]AZQ65599.1 hypothetical protein EI427_25525 [Flammeovirga pectinis]
METIYKWIYNRSNKQYINNIYGLTRSIIAFGTLITLLFNNKSILFSGQISNFSPDLILQKTNLFLLFSYQDIWIPQLISIVILIIVITGLIPKVTGILHWWVSYSFFYSSNIIDGGDQLAVVLTLYLIPITLIDKRKNHWGDSNVKYTRIQNFISYLSFLVIEIQVAFLYFQASIEKPYKVNEWVDGTALYYWFNHNVFGASDWMLFLLNPIIENGITISLLNWSVILFELILASAILLDYRIRKKILIIGILFHFNIILIHGLFSFFFSISASLIIYLSDKSKPFVFHNPIHKIKTIK